MKYTVPKQSLLRRNFVDSFASDWCSPKRALTHLCKRSLYVVEEVLIDRNENIVVEYKYDSWGNHAVLDANGSDIASATHIGNLNPFRYRGYYYDTETGLYFLKTRYYDPEVGRFITTFMGGVNKNGLFYTVYSIRGCSNIICMRWNCSLVFFKEREFC